MSIKKLKEILDEIDYPVLMEIVDCAWYVEDGGWDFHWNTENNTQDLEDGEGDTFSMEAIEGSTRYDSYFVVNGHNGCGQTITYMFNLEKEVKF